MPKIVQRTEQKPWNNKIVSYAVEKKIPVVKAAQYFRAGPKILKEAMAVKAAWDERVDGLILTAIDISRGVRWGK